MKISSLTFYISYKTSNSKKLLGDFNFVKKLLHKIYNASIYLPKLFSNIFFNNRVPPAREVNITGILSFGFRFFVNALETESRKSGTRVSFIRYFVVFLNLDSNSLSFASSIACAPIRLEDTNFMAGISVIPV